MHSTQSCLAHLSHMDVRMEVCKHARENVQKDLLHGRPEGTVRTSAFSFWQTTAYEAPEERTYTKREEFTVPVQSPHSPRPQCPT